LRTTGPEVFGEANVLETSEISTFSGELDEILKDSLFSIWFERVYGG